MLGSLIARVKFNGLRALYPIGALSSIGQRSYRNFDDAAPGEFFYNSAAQAPLAVVNILRKFEALGSNPPGMSLVDTPVLFLTNVLQRKQLCILKRQSKARYLLIFASLYEWTRGTSR